MAISKLSQNLTFSAIFAFTFLGLFCLCELLKLLLEEKIQHLAFRSRKIENLTIWFGWKHAAFLKNFNNFFDYDPIVITNSDVGKFLRGIEIILNNKTVVSESNSGDGISR